MTDAADEVADRQTVLSALGRLPPRMRAAVALRYVADLSEADTGRGRPSHQDHRWIEA